MRRFLTPLLVALSLCLVAAACAGGSSKQAEKTTTTPSVAPTTTGPAAPQPTDPLTGIVVADAVRVGRPALVVKIDNVQPKARPQVGLNQADVVYEERVEGAVTRLLTIFHSTDSAPVGPVRSARTSDIAIFTPLHRPLFAWSGANDFFAARIRKAAIVDVGYDKQPRFYYRDNNRKAPDNLFLRSTAELLAIAPAGSVPPPPLFEYRAKGDVAPPEARPITSVHVTFGTLAGRADVDYVWNGTGWARSQAGTPHLDAAGVQVAPANVIIQFVDYASSGVNDSFGNPIPEAQLLGTGDAWVLTDGKLIPAHWSKPNLEAVTHYTDKDGHGIKLTPGRTWVALPPPGGATNA
jgi:hypothetical protein